MFDQASKTVPLTDEPYVVSVRKVLVVDDELASATLVKTFLEDDGFLVDIALGGEEGLHALRTENYSVAIIDYRMPGKSGLDVLRTLSELNSSVCTIMLTGAEELGVAVDAMRLGAGDFLYKDPSGEYLRLLAGRISRAVERSSLLINKVEDASRLRKLNRTLRILSSCNLTLVRATNEEQLLNDVCNVIVRDGYFQAAWVGYLEDRESPRLYPKASAGDAELNRKLSTACLSAQQTDGCPCCEAAVNQEPILLEDIHADQQFSDWRENLQDTGSGACLSLPLIIAGKVIGVLTILSGDQNPFDTDGRQLFSELAGDLAFGIEVLRTRKEKTLAVDALRESQAHLDTIVENDADGLVVLDKGGIVLFTNPAAESLLGVPKSSLLDTAPELVLDHEINDMEFLQDGRPIRAIQLRQSTITWLGHAATLVSIHDITDRNRLRRNLVDIAEAMGLALEARDPYTAGHQHRVADLAYSIGRKMGLEANMLEGLHLGGAFHDIGKISTPAEILNRPGRLSTIEFELIKTHSQVGYDIIKGIEFPWPIATMVLQHHERMDGSGYPNNLQGDEIIIEARILAVADVVEAMASHRPYRPALGIDMALTEIKANAGRLYDADAVNACVSLFQDGGYAFEY
jgi:putative nucleotidyltransferase with HDIG domain